MGWLGVFSYAMLTALATGLGALPFALGRAVSPRFTAHADAIASGLMLGASFGLVLEGTRHGTWQTLTGALAGVLVVLGAQRWLAGHELGFGELRGAGARRVVLIVGVMTVHSFAEGVAVGSAFAGGLSLALMITVAIAVHNVPEGLAITAVLRPRGISLTRCAAWSVVSSLPQPLMAVPAFLFVDTFLTALPYGVGFAAGAMVLMVFLELLPEAYEHGRRSSIGLVVALSLVAMLLFQQLIAV